MDDVYYVQTLMVVCSTTFSICFSFLFLSIDG